MPCLRRSESSFVAAPRASPCRGRSQFVAWASCPCFCGYSRGRMGETPMPQRSFDSALNTLLGASVDFVRIERLFGGRLPFAGVLLVFPEGAASISLVAGGHVLPDLCP